MSVAEVNPYAAPTCDTEPMPPMMSDQRPVNGNTLVLNTMMCIAMAGGFYSASLCVLTMGFYDAGSFNPGILAIAFFAALPGMFLGFLGSIVVVPVVYFVCIGMRSYKFEWSGIEIAMFTVVCGAVTGASLQYLMISADLILPSIAGLVGAIVSPLCSIPLCKKANRYHASKVPAYV